MNKEKIKDITSLFVVLLIAFFIRVYNLLYFHDLAPDESVYAHAIFALTKGFAPYKEIFLAHPPVYFYLAYPIIFVSPTLYSFRLFNVILSLGTICAIFYLCKILYSKRVAIIAATIYAVYPYAIYVNKLGFLENSTSFFVMMAICLFAQYLKEGRVKNLVISGFFAGISFMTKYNYLLIWMAMVLFGILRDKERKNLIFFFIGSIVAPLGILVSLLITDTWTHFYIQTINWQLVRFGMYPYEKLWFLTTQGFGLLFPLFLIAIPRIINGPGNRNDELMMFCFFVPLLVLPFSKVVFLQHFIPLIAMLSVLAAGTIDQYIPNRPVSLNPMHLKFGFKNIWRKGIIILVAFIILFNYWSLMKLSYGKDWFLIENAFSNEQLKIRLESQMAIGNYIRNITSPSDKIWTTDGAIAFLSQRIIVPPRSEYWKFQGFFQDIWGYGWTKDDYRGPIKDYPRGLISLHDIQSAWEEEKPKVIVIIRTSVVDYFIWHGIDNPYHFEQGLSDYIKSYYHLGNTFYPQNMEVWIRNSGASD
jgi:4-amino-4-deoxy-L-arabinose transferase-like glycosyltransferase